MKWHPKNPSNGPKSKSQTERPNAKAPSPKGAALKPITPRATAIKPKSSTAKPRTQVIAAKPAFDDDRRVYGIHAVSASLTYMPTRAKKLHYVEKNARIEPIINMALAAGIPVEQSARQIFDVNYGSDIVHQGVMLVTAPFPYVTLDNALRTKPKLVVVLDEIEDPRNLGRAARSAFALGASLLIIPENRAASISASAEKAAVGTLSRLPVALVTNLNQAIEKLKKAGLWVIGSAGDATTPLWGCDLTRPTALVIGSEESGLRKLVRENCDETVRIPMDASDMSLNAADALTIMLYEAMRQGAKSELLGNKR
jgi:23S rRNA (guanosine2251-2'-O)-methyltransferase